MQVLFVHGMLRTPLSGFLLLRQLRRQGIKTSTFFYSVTFESFASIHERLHNQVLQLAQEGEYILVGHSLGGVLIRSVLSELPRGTAMPDRVFVLGSPIRPSRIAKYLRRNWLFRILAGDCGQLLGSDERMQEVGPCPVATTSFVGVTGPRGRYSPFGNELNDGIVSASEVTAPWIAEEVEVPVVHSWMPSSKRIAQLIADRISPAKHRED